MSQYSRSVQTSTAEAQPIRRIIEIPWTKAGIIPTIGEESPLIRPTQTLLIVGFSIMVTTPDPASEVNAYLKKNSDGAGGGDLIAHARAWVGTDYGRVSADPPGIVIGGKDTYSIMVYQVGGTAAAGVGGTIEVAA